STADPGGIVSRAGVVTVRTIVLLLTLFGTLSLDASGEARVVTFVVEQRRPFAGGQSFGTVGPYERLDGTVRFEVDPRDPLNAIVVNLDRAPRNAKGRVEFSAPFFILKPVDLRRGNQKLLYTINNRGNKLSVSRFNFTRDNNDPISEADAGDGFLMRQGYILVDAGWQGDVAPGNSRLLPDLPVATRPDGSPIVGAVRIEYSDRTIPPAGTFSLPLEGSAAFRAYAAADTRTDRATLTWRDSVAGPKRAIASDQWAFGRCPTGRESLAASATDICLFEGFKPDRLYELTYQATSPRVMGLGYAITRDIGSFLRYELRDDAGAPNPVAQSATTVGIRRAYSLGQSSTGMYQRDFLYLGFNEDERHRKVFDAAFLSVPGTHRLFANVEFADPNTYSRQDDRHDFLSTSQMPLTFGVTTDPITGIRDGLLKRPATDPLVMQVVTENEFWQFRASLDVADGKGRPVPIPDNVRLYLMSGYEHTGSLPAAFPTPRGTCRYPRNLMYHGPTLRALLVALDAWADRGVEPPPSNYPRVDQGTLVPLAEARAAFPAIPGVTYPSALNGLEMLDFGPDFRSTGGRLTRLPPSAGASYQVLLPKTDADGHNLAGIRPIEIRASVGTHTGWNLRDPAFRGGVLCGLSGSYFPYAATAADRKATGDPRPSLEERYGNHAGYVRAVRAAAAALVEERFLLEEDAQRYVREADASPVLRD
ncbi:MAG: alpha/beta hydrolase domain-containing protein, partial [Vicinamibacterales bacterium]